MTPLVITPINGYDRGTWRNRYILGFGGPYGYSKVLMVWANGLDSALDEAVDWLAEHAPGLLCDDEVARIFHEEVAEHGEEKAQEIATQDTTCAGNCSNYLRSEDWAIVAENPTREQILELQGRSPGRNRHQPGCTV
jgi:hypothetical protein